MFSFLDRSAGNVLGVKASGTLTHADYQQLVPRLEELIRRRRKVRVLCQMEDFQGWEVRAAWDDLKGWFKNGGNVDRCAVVGENKWQERIVKLFRPFCNLKYFDRSRLEQAWQWVLEGETHPGERHAKQHGPAILRVLTTCQSG